MKTDKCTKLRMFIIAICLGTMVNLNAQVTIGSALEPNKGALLDLKETDVIGANSLRGLGLPRVSLEKEDDMDGLAIDKGDDYKNVYIGLVVYNLASVSYFCPGPYVWNGERWEALSIDQHRACKPRPVLAEVESH
ncbi:hypothetical protein M2132_001689 [Dysgonomonas sp. PH5-45]|uniref:hypothetical protein n=1 Tax=unclassified Dysgonomonas TaxID=2630389 RepID=UPI0024735A02|nr:MULTISPECIES: hypothetical protein [unclassified Dysgonomonas]MDH6355348.1 hypothetical protein [Dysgonomonas sp. PH5-45]MDH6388246.1 hypothetical protein [Dysgonomonas sp. PH5-37]